MEFEDYLKSKKIDPEKFKKAEEDRYFEFKKLFDVVHPNSFTQQKLFLINKIRRDYHLVEADPDGVGTAGMIQDEKQTKAKPRPHVGAKAKPKVPAKPRVRPDSSTSGDKVKAKIPTKPKIQSKPKVQQKPVVKPRIPTKPTDENNDSKAPESAAKRKPQIKPKIPTKPKSE